MLIEMVTQGVLATDPATRITIQRSRYKEPVEIPSIAELQSGGAFERVDRPGELRLNQNEFGFGPPRTLTVFWSSSARASKI